MLTASNRSSLRSRDLDAAADLDAVLRQENRIRERGQNSHAETEYEYEGEGGGVTSCVLVRKKSSRVRDYAVDYRGSTASRGFLGNFSAKRPERGPGESPRGAATRNESLFAFSAEVEKTFRGRACSRLPV